MENCISEVKTLASVVRKTPLHKVLRWLGCLASCVLIIISLMHIYGIEYKSSIPDAELGLICSKLSSLGYKEGFIWFFLIGFLLSNILCKTIIVYITPHITSSEDRTHFASMITAVFDCVDISYYACYLICACSALYNEFFCLSYAHVTSLVVVSYMHILFSILVYRYNRNYISWYKSYNRHDSVPICDAKGQQLVVGDRVYCNGFEYEVYRDTHNTGVYYLEPYRHDGDKIKINDLPNTDRLMKKSNYT